MAYIQASGGGKNIVNVMYQGGKVSAGTNIVVNEEAFVGDIFVLFNFSQSGNSGYAVAVSGCEVVGTFDEGSQNNPHQVTVLRALSDNISFKIPYSYQGAEYTRFTKMGKAINVSITQFVNSSSTTDKTVNINANKDDVVVIPWVPVQTGATVTPTDSKKINDNIEFSSSYHLYSFRVTGNSGTSFYFYRVLLGSYILLS